MRDSGGDSTVGSHEPQPTGVRRRLVGEKAPENLKYESLGLSQARESPALVVLPDLQIKIQEAHLNLTFIDIIWNKYVQISQLYLAILFPRFGWGSGMPYCQGSFLPSLGAFRISGALTPGKWIYPIF